LGEIFRLTRVLSLKMTVNRDTGAMTIINDTGEPFAIKGYTVASSAGALNAAAFTPVTGNFDAPPGGDGSIDPNDGWQVTSPAGSKVVFTESSLGDAGSLPAGGQLELSAANGWIKSRFQDVTLNITLGDGSLAFGAVEYVGNNGQPFSRIDLDLNGTINLDDWRVFAAGHRTSLAGLTPLEQSLRGDLNGSGANDYDDFVLFRTDYDAAHGAGALAKALAEVPEPTSAVLIALAAGACSRRRRDRSYRRVAFDRSMPTLWLTKSSKIASSG
jgi:hypothetical protein